MSAGFERMCAYVPPPEVRPAVARFAAIMEEKLAANDWKGSWAATPAPYLAKRLLDEVLELLVALVTGTPEEIAREAADVANFALMLADTCGRQTVEAA